MRTRVRASLAASCLLAGGLLSTASAQVKVGVILPLSGPSATIGEDVRRAVELAVDDVNKAGGVKGQRFEVIIEDSAGNPTTALGAARKLISVDKVPVVLGEYSSGITLPMAQYVVGEKTTHMNIASTSVKVRELGPLSFNLVGLEDRGGEFAAKDSYALGLRKVAIIAPNNAHGQGTAHAFRTEFGRLGGEVVGEVLYTAGQPSYRRELQQLDRRKPDGYVYTAYGQEAAIINREARDLGLRSKPWYAILLSNAISDTPPDIAQGQLGMELGSFQGKVGQDYAAAFQKKYKDPVRSSFSGYAYDGIHMAAKAMDNAASTSPEDIRKALVALGQQGYSGVTGEIRFDDKGQRIEPPYATLKYDGGKVVAR
ncbi:ABC transporter substrate-binding protein [Bordetella genomosp. 12]|uniref:Amino acid ABC transporter n=1 Tax=Bordetella genomosp. 12 TaxID=463035 RepID=A0A261V9N8_9BORD|nr:ABC transporter substrate-binding protein [Bordetella genomosp. 12]OZI70878.1 amino acid ABC transporter [Bordetella genomosp. 12]